MPAQAAKLSDVALETGLTFKDLVLIQDAALLSLAGLSIAACAWSVLDLLWEGPQMPRNVGCYVQASAKRLSSLLPIRLDRVGLVLHGASSPAQVHPVSADNPVPLESSLHLCRP